jgi:outer membrane protein assembly factor BamA
VQSRLADVQINGVEASRLADARKALNVTVGDAFAPNTPAEASRRLRAFYAARGYRRATVTHAISRQPDANVAVAWTVKEGPLHIVKDVSVVGAESTNTGLVRDAVTLEPETVLSQDTIDSTRRNLYDIGSFRRIDFDFGESSIEPTAAGPLPVAVTIQAEEPRRFQLKYGIQFTLDRSSNGLSTTGVGASIELQDRNLIGRAVQASLGAHGEPDLQAVVLALTSPRFFGKRLRTNLFARVRYEQDELDNGRRLDERRREVTVQQRWRPVRPLELVWGYGYSLRRFRLFENEQPIDLGGPLAGPSFAVVMDTRDSPFDAKRGLFHSSSVQVGMEALGSDLGYIRYLLRQSNYRKLGPVTAAGSVRFGTLDGYSGIAPVSIIDLLFLAGGTNTVRGYPEGSLSAVTVSDIDLGGTALLVLNGELRFPISRRLSGAGFVDAGNTFFSATNVTLSELAVGAGLGVRIQTPLVPLRLDFAFPLTTKYGHSGLRVHFSIGQMF